MNLRFLEGWRGYLIWLAALLLLTLGVIDGDQFAVITAGVAVQKGAEGAARNLRR